MLCIKRSQFKMLLPSSARSLVKILVTRRQACSTACLSSAVTCRTDSCHKRKNTNYAFYRMDRSSHQYNFNSSSFVIHDIKNKILQNTHSLLIPSGHPHPVNNAPSRYFSKHPKHDNERLPSKEKIREAREILKDKFEKENIMTIPNMLTMSRVVLTPVLGYLVLSESYSLSCGLFLVAGVTDLLDGWIARRYPSQQSSFGSFLDPLADKFLVSILFVTLTYVNLIPLPLTALVVARDVSLVAAAFYVRYISLEPPITFVSFFDATHGSAQLKPLFISKVNTLLQLFLVASSLAAPVFGMVDHYSLQALWYLTASTTFISGVGYMFAKDTFKIQNKKIKNRTQ